MAQNDREWARKTPIRAAKQLQTVANGPDERPFGAAKQLQAVADGPDESPLELRSGPTDREWAQRNPLAAAKRPQTVANGLKGGPKTVEKLVG